MNHKNKSLNVIIQMTKAPEPGYVKTRLISHLGEWGALRLHKRLTVYISNQLKAIDCNYKIYCDEPEHPTIKEMMKEAGYLNKVYQQIGKDLGERMLNAIIESLAFSGDSGTQKVAIIGSDCPFIDEAIINTTFGALDHHDIVIVPADDGGYVLIAMKKAYPQFFSDMPWGTHQVCEKTLSIAEDLALSVKLLPALPDIDRPEDLAQLQLIDFVID